MARKSKKKSPTKPTSSASGNGDSSEVAATKKQEKAAPKKEKKSTTAPTTTTTSTTTAAGPPAAKATYGVRIRTTRRAPKTVVVGSSPKRGTLLSWAGHGVRIVVLDLPLTLLFSCFVLTLIVRYVHDEYLLKQLQATEWTLDRQEEEATYYHRECVAEDLTTTNVEDLKIPSHFTADDSLHHMMTHGISIYSDILSRETAQEMRSFIMRRNAELTEKDSIGVISNSFRFSFGIGANEDPIVPKALAEITSHPQFRPALEKIAGKNPAMIEMTAISATYGAKNQHWHWDTSPDAAALKYARSFVPSYSLFINLQDMHRSMGATQVCPGSHICADDAVPLHCVDEGVYVTGPEDFVAAGTALFMNQQSFHRGTAHYDPRAPLRSYFILTFAPRPREVAETRMIGQAGSYSARWDMWGHTLDDLADAPRRMAQPWAALRSMGIYKLPGTQWGYDYPSMVSMRMMNQDTGYSRADLDDYLANGGLGLPQVLTGVVMEAINEEDYDEGEELPHEESWYEYYHDTLERFVLVSMVVNLVVTGTYLFVAGIISLLAMCRDHARAPSHESDDDEDDVPVSKSSAALFLFRRVIIRICVTHVTVALLAYAFIKLYIDQTHWAQDIRAGRRFLSPFAPPPPVTDEWDAQVTFPRREDVLISVRYDADFLESYNLLVDYHPGNVAWRRQTAAVVPPVWRSDWAAKVVHDLVVEDQRRFLLQRVDRGEWTLLSLQEAERWTERAMIMARYPLLAALYKRLDFARSRLRHDVLGRHLVMNGRRWMQDYLTQWEARLLAAYEGEEETTKTTSSSILLVDTTPVREDTDLKIRSAVLTQPVTLVQEKRRVLASYRIRTADKWNDANVDEEEEEENEEDELDLSPGNFYVPSVGEVVYGQYGGTFNEWYKGTVTRISGDGLVDVEYDDGDEDSNLAVSSIRRYVPPRERDVAQCRLPYDEDTWMTCVVEKLRHDGLYGVLLETGERATRLQPFAIRRIEWSFAQEDEVACRFRGQLGWYRGRITRKRQDGTYDVAYADGDFDFKVKQQDLHYLWAMDGWETVL